MPEASELLGQVIQTLNSGDFEERLSAWLSASVPHDNLVVIAYFQDRKPFSLFSRTNEPRVLQHFDSQYVSGAYLLDPYHTLHVDQAQSGLYRLSDIEPDQFRRNRYYLEYYKNTSLVDEIAYVCWPVPGVSVHVALGRDATSQKKYSPKDIKDARELAPVVCALGECHWTNLNSTGKFEEKQVVDTLIEQTLQLHDIKLSPRQAQVALMILRGYSSVSIGLQLKISAQTVKVFRRQLYKKCQISSQAELFNLLMPVLRL